MAFPNMISSRNVPLEACGSSSLPGGVLLSQNSALGLQSWWQLICRYI